MAESRISDVDEYGFKRPEGYDYEQHELIMSKYLVVLTNRSRKWDQFMKSKPNLHNNKSRQLKRYIRKGIPIHLRPRVWMEVSGGFAQQKKSPDLYQSLLQSQFDGAVVESIKIDLPRTFPDNMYFDSDEIRYKLFNVLVAYAHHNREVGYCQGLNYIAGLILLVTKNEEWTFWLLKTLLDTLVQSYHTKTMEGLRVDTAVLRELIIERAPTINERLEGCGLPCAVISTKWLICLFAEVLPTETVLRIWDCIFNEGYKILFRVSLTLLMGRRQEIEQAEDIITMANLLRDMVNAPEVNDCHRFMESIFKVPGSLKRINLEQMRIAARNVIHNR